MLLFIFLMFALFIAFNLYSVKKLRLKDDEAPTSVKWICLGILMLIMIAFVCIVFTNQVFNPGMMAMLVFSSMLCSQFTEILCTPEEEGNIRMRSLYLVVDVLIVFALMHFFKAVPFMSL